MEDKLNGSYDFIVVGGGSSGATVATRLSENPNVRVLLLEAGGSPWHPYYMIPIGFVKMTKGIGSWGWDTVPQKHLNGRVLRFTQAKVLGGGSSINAQVYTRGNSADFDEWRQLGCQGWSYQDVLPFFKKAEDNDSFENEFHGSGGPIGVSQPSSPLPICEAFFEAAEKLGIPRNHDLTGEKQEGVGYYQLTQKNARRSSTVTGYLQQARNRPNLIVRRNSHVTRILVDKGRAIGIELKSDRDSEKLFAKSEVIVSSGAIGTPKLLMQSGIGPADHLVSLGIETVFDCKSVGENLHDHLDIFTICECTGDHSYDKYSKLHWSMVAGLRYLLTKGGPMASSLFETGGFWYVDKNARSPDIQFHFGVATGIEAGVAKMTNPGVTLNSAFNRPRSRGTVRLASANPSDAPLIDPNYWQDPYDRGIAIKGLKLAQEIMRQEPLKRFVKEEVLPGPTVQSEQDYVNYACEHAKTDHHPVGTCRMGSDPDAVVDPELNFNGLEQLRIADASIMPRIVSSNTNATAIMIGEKAADMIRKQHGIS